MAIKRKRTKAAAAAEDKENLSDANGDVVKDQTATKRVKVKESSDGAEGVVKGQSTSRRERHKERTSKTHAPEEEVKEKPVADEDPGSVKTTTKVDIETTGEITVETTVETTEACRTSREEDNDVSPEPVKKKRVKHDPHVIGKGPPMDGDWRDQISTTPPEDDELKIAHWNVNGLRRVLKTSKNEGDKSDLEMYIREESPDALCLNETKIDKEVEETLTERFPDYKCLFVHSAKKGYAGVGVLLKKSSILCTELISHSEGIGDDEHDAEGRTLTLVYPKIYLVASYVANAGQGLKRLDYRIDKFDPSMHKFLNNLKTSRPVIWCGDLNVAYEEIDIWNSKANQKSAGHTPQERASFGAFLADGQWVDVWRKQHPEERRYTYWSARFPKLRSESLGWRLDYFIASDSIAQQVGKVHIRDLFQGSDHCPIVLYLKRSLVA